MNAPQSQANRVADIAEHYVSAYGLHLVPLPARSKKPAGNGWGLPENLLSTPEKARDHYEAQPRHNIGVALGPSRLCSLDIDDAEAFNVICAEFGWSLPDLIDAHPTVQGQAPGVRIMFRVPDGVELPYHSLTWPMRDGKGRFTVFEVRAAMEQQRQDVLPPSIHPDAGLPYVWITPPEAVQGFIEPPRWLLSLWSNWAALKPQFEAVCPWAPRRQSKAPARTRPQQARDSVIDAYNAAHSIESALSRYGYTEQGRRWLSPHSTTGLPGVNVLEDNRAFIHHASDPLCSAESGQPVAPFDLFRLYEHNNDVRAAVKAAAAELGMGRQVRPNVDPETGEILPAAAPRAPTPDNDNAPQPLDKPLEHPEAVYHPDHIAWKRNKETGEWEFHQAKGTSENLLRLLRAYGIRIRYNELSRDVEISVNGKLPTGDLARNGSLSMVEDLCRLNDYPYTAAAGHLDNLAARDAYNPALVWVKSRQWDGGDHIRALFDCLTLADQGMAEISWTLFRKWFLGAVAILSGKANKFEHVLVLVDPMGGLGKTRFFNTLCPKEFQADGVTLKTDDKDSVLQVVSKWIVELGEIGATFSKSDIESLKAFLSRESDELRPAYARAANRYQRRTAFFGSVNNVQFLMDDTNNRRFWPIQVAAVNYQHTVDVQQAWAEALARVERGEAWHLDQDENRAIGAHNEAFRSKDFIEERILSLYDTGEYRCRYVSASDVLEEIGVKTPPCARIVVASIES